MSLPIPVTNSTWQPLSAQYIYDKNIHLPNTTVLWYDGYSGSIQEIFRRGVDVSLNKDTTFYLPSAKNIFDFIESLSLDGIEFGAYAVISAETTFTPSIQYVSVIDDALHLSPVSSDSSFFSFILNEENRMFSLMNGSNYVTVENRTMFNLNMEPQLSENDKNRQLFNWHEINGKIIFSTYTKNPAVVGPATEERFWSYSKAGPDKGRVRANGMAGLHDYVFNVSGLIMLYVPDGLITDHAFVKYYNELANKTNNRNVMIKDAQDIKVNHLIDLPYNTKIDIANKSMDINFANLKNFKTSESGY